MKFKIALDVRGDFICTFVFTSEGAKDRWVKTEFPKLQEEYGKLTFTTRGINPPNIGDKCHVAGEGSEVFKVLKLHKYEDHRYGFLINNCCCEEVHKCTRLPKKEKT